MKYLAALTMALGVCLSPLVASASTKFVLTSASATACTSIAASAKELLAVVNTSTSAQTATLSFYDEGASPTCASADNIYSVVLSASQVVNFTVLSNEIGGYLAHGLAYSLSVAAANNVVVIYQ
jgi:hypothetical protein